MGIRLPDDKINNYPIQGKLEKRDGQDSWQHQFGVRPHSPQQCIWRIVVLVLILNETPTRHMLALPAMRWTV
jgi:hypothetical protein